MPASTRTYVSRATTSTRPYDRRSPSASPMQLLSHPSPPSASLMQNPDHPGLPTHAEYKQIEAGYIHSLSPRKRDKALITQAMFDKIWDVLHQPEACTIETPQFRFWVRKMFTLSWPTTTVADVSSAQRQCQWGSGPVAHPRDACTYAIVDGENHGEDEDEDDEEDLELERAMGITHGTDADAALLSSAVVLHENRPVAIMEQLYELFCYCHVRAGHGGRDKTCAVIRQHYSWVPKELTAQFVKACPTCALKRSGGGGGELGVVVQRRTNGGRERKRKGVTVSKGGACEQPSSPGWPTTGGPLDPENPLPCGMRQREQLQRVYEHAKPISPSNLVSSARDSRIGLAPKETFLGNSLSSGWSNMPRAATAHPGVPPSPFRVHDPIHSYASQTFPIDTIHTDVPGQSGDLPSLATALSNESLDDNLNLTGLGEDEGGECLPSALWPLRLSGPISSTTGPGALESEDADLFQCQIDPVLLSFAYPGVGHTNTRMHTPFGIDGAGLAISPTRRGGMPASGHQSQDQCVRVSPHRDYRLHATSVAPALPILDTSDSTTASSGSGSPDSRFEKSGMGIFKPFVSPRRSPSRHCGSGLATILLSCSTDDSADGPRTLSRFSILTDA